MLYQNDAEMIFPARVIPTLRNLRGQDWQQLVQQVMDLPEDAPDALAFSLMMIRTRWPRFPALSGWRGTKRLFAITQPARSNFFGPTHSISFFPTWSCPAGVAWHCSRT